MTHRFAQLTGKQQSARLVLAAALALVAMVTAAPAAFAHPGLIRSDPSDTATVGAPPRAVRLWFSEPISAQFSTARVLDVNGAEVPLARVSTDLAAQRQLAVELPDNLVAGVYNVDWKVLSDADGHVTQGHVVFGIGQPDQTQALSPSAQELPVAPVEVLLRWLNLLSLTAVVGGLAIAELILAAAAAGRQPEGPEHAPVLMAARRRALVWATAWAGVALLVGVGLLVWQSTTLGDSARARTGWDVGWQLISQTRWGALWLGRQAILAALTAGALLLLRAMSRTAPPARPWPVVASLAVLAVALMAVQALAGHAPTLGSNLATAVAVDALHLLAASVWMGGLLALLVALLPWLRPSQSGFMATLACWRKFAWLAALSVGVLVPTGLYASGRQVASLDGLLTSFYGQTLLMKLLLVVVVGTIGLVNLALLYHGRAHTASPRRVTRLLDWARRSRTRLRVYLLVEAGVGCLVLFATATLTSAVPANGLEFAPPITLPAPTASQSVKDLLVTIEVKPNLAGPNVIMVRATSTRRPRPAPVSGVALRFTYLGQDRTELDDSPAWVKMERLDPMTYRLGGEYLTRPGAWRIDVEAHRLGSQSDIATFNWNVAAPVPAPRPVLFSNQPLAPLLTPASVIVAILVVMVITGARLRRHPLPRPDRRRRAPPRRGAFVVEMARKD